MSSLDMAGEAHLEAIFVAFFAKAGYHCQRINR